MERERDMRAKEAKTGVAHEASSRREGGTVRPDRRERVRRSASASGPNAPKVERLKMQSRTPGGGSPVPGARGLTSELIILIYLITVSPRGPPA